MISIVTNTDLDYFGNWSPEFHLLSTDIKTLVKEDKQRAISKINHKLIYKSKSI
jgi:hypothetical protein